MASPKVFKFSYSGCFYKGESRGISKLSFSVCTLESLFVKTEGALFEGGLIGEISSSPKNEWKSFLNGLFRCSIVTFAEQLVGLRGGGGAGVCPGFFPERIALKLATASSSLT